MTTREAAVTALVSLVSGAYAWGSPISRRLKLWGDVPLANRPACFVFSGGNQSYQWRQSVDPKRQLLIRLFIYTNAKDQSIVGATELDNIMDALDAALAPGPGRTMQTLGGLVAWARIDGEVLIEPGDLDGDGLAIVPIRITL